MAQGKGLGMDRKERVGEWVCTAWKEQKGKGWNGGEDKNTDTTAVANQMQWNGAAIGQGGKKEVSGTER